MHQRARWTLSLCLAAVAAAGTLPAAPGVTPVFPGKTWQWKDPAQVGMDRAKLDEFARYVGGRGCIVRARLRRLRVRRRRHRAIFRPCGQRYGAARQQSPQRGDD